MLECPRCGSTNLVTKGKGNSYWLGTKNLKFDRNYGWNVGHTNVPDDAVVCMSCGYVFKPGWRSNAAATSTASGCLLPILSFLLALLSFSFL